MDRWRGAGGPEVMRGRNVVLALSRYWEANIEKRCCLVSIMLICWYQNKKGRIISTQTRKYCVSREMQMLAFQARDTAVPEKHHARHVFQCMSFIFCVQA